MWAIIRSVTKDKLLYVALSSLWRIFIILEFLFFFVLVDQVVSGRRHVGIMSAEPVGIMGWGNKSTCFCLQYGVSFTFLVISSICFHSRLLFEELHKTGIFMWDYLYHLGSNKSTLMRDYIKTLKKHGLSRDPPSPRRKWLLNTPWIYWWFTVLMVRRQSSHVHEVAGQWSASKLMWGDDDD